MIPRHNQDGFAAHGGRQGSANGAALFADRVKPPQGSRRHHQLSRVIPGFLYPETIYAFNPANNPVYTRHDHNDSFID
jgi:hypothetical protein